MNRLFWVVLVFFAWAFFSSFYSFAEAAASLKLSPDKETVTKDAVFSVSILVSTGGETINFVSANLDFPKDKLRVDSFDESQTFITIWPEKSYNNDLGRVELAGALYNPGINGNDLRLLTIKFKAVGNAGDSATVSFRDSSEVYRLSDTSNVLGAKTSGTYLVSGTPVTPLPTPTTNPSITTTPTQQPREPSPTIILGGPVATAPATLIPSPNPSLGGELPKTGQFSLTATILFLGLLIIIGGFSLSIRQSYP